MPMVFDTDVLPLYSTKVSNDPNYQSPGNFKIPANYIDGTNETRMLTVIEVIRSYVAVMVDHSEAKLFNAIVGKMISELPLGGGSTFSATKTALAVQTVALGHFSKHVRPTVL